MPTPPPAYRSGPGEALDVDRDRYARLASRTADRQRVEQFTVPIRSGRAWEVPAGHLCRISTRQLDSALEGRVWR